MVTCTVLKNIKTTWWNNRLPNIHGMQRSLAPCCKTKDHLQGEKINVYWPRSGAHLLVANHAAIKEQSALLCWFSLSLLWSVRRCQPVEAQIARVMPLETCSLVRSILWGGTTWILASRSGSRDRKAQSPGFMHMFLCVCQACLLGLYVRVYECENVIHVYTRT